MLITCFTLGAIICSLTSTERIATKYYFVVYGKFGYNASFCFSFKHIYKKCTDTLCNNIIE